MSVILINQTATAAALKAESVHMVITSPPYFKLRAYATGQNKGQEIGIETAHDCAGWATGQDCGACYVCKTRQWAREVWRVLRPEGTFWLNIGDSYNGSRKTIFKENRSLKPKDLIGIPWRVALALQADGWTLRNAIIWHKPAPMPESAQDRFTNAYEHIFLFSKQEKYYFDREAVKEPTQESSKKRAKRAIGANKYTVKEGISGKNNPPQNPLSNWRYEGNKAHGYGKGTYSGKPVRLPEKANKRDVWRINTSQYKGSHYATYPPELVETPIKAGTSEHGVCLHCGAPWQRTQNAYQEKPAGWLPTCECYRTSNPTKKRRQDLQNTWKPRAQAGRAPVKPAIVYDPFVGSGTTLEVARLLGRNGIGGDLSMLYLVEEAKPRLLFTQLENWQAGKPQAPKKPAQAPELQPLPLFAGMDV